MKKIVPIILAAVLAVSSSFSTIGAAHIDETDMIGGTTVSPCFMYTNSIETGLSIYNNIANCTSDVYGDSSTVTKITVIQTLQVLDGNQWRYCDSWTKTVEKPYCLFANASYTMKASGTYRTKTEAKVYSGENYETVYSYSASVVYTKPSN